MLHLIRSYHIWYHTRYHTWCMSLWYHTRYLAWYHTWYMVQDGLVPLLDREASGLSQAVKTFSRRRNTHLSKRTSNQWCDQRRAEKSSVQCRWSESRWRKSWPPAHIWLFSMGVWTVQWQTQGTMLSIWHSGSPLQEQEPPGTLYINIVSYMISYLISYPISGIILIRYMYISFLRTHTAPVAEWDI